MDINSYKDIDVSKVASEFNVDIKTGLKSEEIKTKKIWIK